VMLGCTAWADASGCISFTSAQPMECTTRFKKHVGLIILIHTQAYVPLFTTIAVDAYYLLRCGVGYLRIFVENMIGRPRQRPLITRFICVDKRGRKG